MRFDDTRSFKVCERCGKRLYRSAKAARDANRTAPYRIRVYQCGPGWHVTNGEKR